MQNISSPRRLLRCSNLLRRGRSLGAFKFLVLMTQLRDCPAETVFFHPNYTGVRV